MIARHAAVVAVLVIAGCSSVGPRTASTVDVERARLTVPESVSWTDCRPWAQRQARIEFAPQRPDGAPLRRNSTLIDARTQRAMDDHAWEAFNACMLAAYARLMEQNPPTPDAYRDAARIAAGLGRSSDFEAAQNRLTTEFPDHELTRTVALERASVAFWQKKWTLAITYATQAAKSTDDAVRSKAWTLVGESELKQKHNDAAVKAFTAALAVVNADDHVRYRARAGRALAQEQRQHFADALADYESVASGTQDSTLRDWAQKRANALKARLDSSDSPL